MVLALMLPVASVSHAEETETDNRAREVFLKGDRAYAEGDYESALESFEEAYALSERHALLYNMANAHERLGQYQKAVDKLQRYLPYASSAQRDLIEKRIARLQERLEEQRAKIPDPPPEKIEEEPDEPQQPEVKESSASIKTEDLDSSSPSYLGYTLVGVGALGLGVGGYFGLQALDARSSAKKNCLKTEGGQRCTTDAQDAVDRDKNNSLLADVSMGAGLASAAIGIYLILTHDDQTRETEASTSVFAAPRAGGGQVDVVLRF